MGIKLILSSLFVILLLLIVSCTSEPKVNPSAPAIYIVSSTAEEPQVKTFVVGEEGSVAWLEETKVKRHELNMIRYAEDYKDELEEYHKRRNEYYEKRSNYKK